MSTPERVNVSLCMIVRNEAHQLEPCLSPVADLFDQIVIVDTGSRDATVEIAQKFTPHVHHFPWCDDFSAARNETLRHAAGRWIFWLDADDRLSPENVARLKATLASLPDHAAEFMMDTVCVSQRVGESERLISHPRLFSRHPQLRWQGRVHEQLRPCPTTLGFELIHSDVKIEHVGYCNTAVREAKRRRDLRLLRMDYAVDPNEPATLFHLGQAHAELGNVADARKYLSRLLELEQRPLNYMRRVFSTLCELAMVEGQFQNVVTIADRALATFPRDPHISYLLAEALYELDHYQDAERLLVEIINRPQSLEYHAGTPNDIEHLLAPRSLGEVLRVEGSLAAAESVLQIVVNQFPRDTMAWHALGRVYIDMRDRQKLEAVRTTLGGCPEGGVYSLLLLAAWHLLVGDHGAAEPVVDQLIAEAPRLPLPRIMRAISLDRRDAPPTVRLQAYRDVLRVQPGHALARSVVPQLEAALRLPVPTPVTVPVTPLSACSTVTFWAGATV